MYCDTDTRPVDICSLLLIYSTRARCLCSKTQHALHSPLRKSNVVQLTTALSTCPSRAFLSRSCSHSFNTNEACRGQIEMSLYFPLPFRPMQTACTLPCNCQCRNGTLSFIPARHHKDTRCNSVACRVCVYQCCKPPHVMGYQLGLQGECMGGIWGVYGNLATPFVMDCSISCWCCGIRDCTSFEH